MNNTIKTIFTLLFILSLAIELTYNLGVWTRQYVLPAVLWVYVVAEHYSTQAWEALTTQEWSVKIYNTPLTTGLSFG